MPQRNKVKVYVNNAFYHIYNRGVDKRTIFEDDQDYRVFLHLLKYYLSPKNESINHPLEVVPNYSIVRPRPINNLNKEVELHAFCLMSNHFHLLIKQITKEAMTKLMRKLLTTYAMYFNKRHERVGHLFEGTYKAARVNSDNYILHLSRYIHLNSSELTGTNPVSYPYSSYAYYVGNKKADWVKTTFILKYFNKSNLLSELKKFPSYKRFVEEYKKDARELLGTVTLE